MKAPIQTVLLPRTPMLAQPQVSYLIRELRQLTAWTQEELAAALGVAYGTINRWKTDAFNPLPLPLSKSTLFFKTSTNLQFRRCGSKVSSF